MDSGAHKFQPIDEQTRLENQQRALLEAYRLAQFDVDRLLVMRAANGAGHSEELETVAQFLAGRIEQLEQAE